MSIPVKLRISTKHILPTNHAISMYDQYREKTMQEVDEMADIDMPYPSDDDLQEMLSASSSEDADDAENLPDVVSIDADEAMEEIRQHLEAMLDQYFSQQNDENTGRFIFTTEAEMEVLPGQITLTYDEADDSTLGKTRNIIRFDRANPHSLSIQRSGELMNTLVCEKGRRHTSVYNSPLLPMALEACTYTRRCDVDLDEEGGVVFLDYLIEIRGADVQRTTIRMDIVPLDK